VTAPPLVSTERSRTGLRRGLRRGLLWLCAAALALLAADIGLHEAARHLLAARTPLEPADAIVVLGGESQERPDRAAALYRRGLAPLVIVSGDGDCLDVAERLRAGGVGPGAIRLDCLSGNTAENAAFSARILRSAGARSVIVVTSWWHTERAFRCFVRSAPDMKVFMELPVDPPHFWRTMGRPDGVHVQLEYLKMLWYRLPGVNRC
jgi:uncharacterized SAM-binding protein YcdF (DUF218 family)